ncbi:MAG TPA: DUF2807 domain-containing protein [Oculatellaceae cyanobacterium]
MKILKPLFPPAIVLLISGCSQGGSDAIQGSGKIITDKRDGLAAFKTAVLGGAAQYKISKAGTCSVEIIGDDNITPHVRTSVENGELSVSLSSAVNGAEKKDSDHISVSPSKELVINIAAPEIDSVIFSGAGGVQIENVKADKFSLTISGAGNVTTSGEAKDASITISGAGNAKMNGLKVQNAKVSITGTGDAEVDVKDSIESTISGVGHVLVKGHPPKVKNSVTGVGDVQMLN